MEDRPLCLLLILFLGGGAAPLVLLFNYRRFCLPAGSYVKRENFGTLTVGIGCLMLRCIGTGCHIRLCTVGSLDF